RTPLITKPWASRDHWPQANTILLAGNGVAGGHVLGRTDSKAAEVTDFPISPADVVATMLSALGANPRGEVHDRQGRPFTACDGPPIERVYTGCLPRSPREESAMKCPTAVLLSLLAAPTARPQDAPDPKSDEQRIQGTWAVESWQERGKPLTAEELKG